MFLDAAAVVTIIIISTLCVVLYAKLMEEREKAEKLCDDIHILNKREAEVTGRKTVAEAIISEHQRFLRIFVTESDVDRVLGRLAMILDDSFRFSIKVQCEGDMTALESHKAEIDNNKKKFWEAVETAQKVIGYPAVNSYKDFLPPELQDKKPESAAPETA